MIHKYLDSKLKKYYLDGLKEASNHSDRFHCLDDNVISHLNKININDSIQTIYSKRKGLNKHYDSESYLWFCYVEALETVLKNQVEQWFENECFRDSVEFTFELQSYNKNYDGTVHGLKCLDDKDYFRVNHVQIHLFSHELIHHQRFWEILADRLSGLNP